MIPQFPLLNVTDVVFDEILSQLELNEIFNLSICSLKTADIVRCHLRKSIRYPLFVDTKEKNGITFGFIREKERVNMMSIRHEELYTNQKEFEEVNIKAMKLNVCKYQDHYSFFVYPEDEPDAFSLVLSHIADLFREYIKILYCNSPWMMSCIGLQNSGSLWMTYAGGDECEEFVKLSDYELETSIKTGGLQLCSYLSKDYNFALTREYEYVRVERAPEARSYDVLDVAVRSKEVVFDQSDLVSKSLNNIFKIWLENRIDRLKFLSIRMKSYKEFLAFIGMEHRISDTTEEVNYKSYTGELYQLSPGKRLRRDDGVIASFSYDPNTQILNFGVVDVVN
uniref:F-box domain-containing protein n=1 Tax=Caenorhabditis tropicalis TaxID=1561998 RepID=A0A1I7UZJ7_9PELO